MPFPKTERWWQIVGRLLPSAEGSNEFADTALRAVRHDLEALPANPSVVKAATFLAALPVASRAPEPSVELEVQFGIRLESPVDLTSLLTSVDSYVPEGLGRMALQATFREYLARPHLAQAIIGQTDGWEFWRELDGSPFCEIARQFFAELVELYMLQSLGAAAQSLPEPQQHVFRNAVAAEAPAIERHAFEATRITQSFAARWFNKLVKGQIPEAGSVRWFLAHSLGKVDMELEREESNHEAPIISPWKKRYNPNPRLDL